MYNKDLESDNGLAAVQAWRDYSRELKQGFVEKHLIKTFGLAGSFTVDALSPYLGGELLLKGVEAPSFAVAPHNQLHQLCLNPSEVFGEDGLSAIILLWRLEDLFLKPLEQALSDEQQISSLMDGLDALLQAIGTLRKKYSGSLIVSTPPYPSLLSFDPREPAASSRGMDLHGLLSRHWSEGLARIERIHTFELHGLLQQVGYDASRDPLKWYLYKQPYSNAFLPQLASQLSRSLIALSKSAKKCLVVDCDNTLWGGVLGEDGISGIEIGNDFPGSAFRDFQKYILHLRTQGTIIAVASRNNLEDVLEVFDKHDSMVLKKEHITEFQVHWDSKVKSIQAIAKALNIGTDALVFIDDNPKEIDEIRKRLPEVSCYLVPGEAALLPELLLGEGLFDTTAPTHEDLHRAERFKAEQERKEQLQTMSEAEFIDSLELNVDFFQAEPQHLARIAQLINKTNQFNLTTIRRSHDEVVQLHNTEGTRIFAIDVSDRYGDYGLVGSAILRRKHPDEWLIETLLISCRALGRGIETIFLTRLAAAVEELGGKRLLGEYRPSGKNAQVRDFYKNHGFEFDLSRNAWAISPGALLER
jgi:FkbH-like protein